MKRINELENAVVSALAGMMKHMPEFKNVQMKNDNLPVILINVEGDEPNLRIEIVASDTTEERIGDQLQTAQKNIDELKDIVRALASVIIGDSIDAVEFDGNNPYVGGWIFTDEAWEANRETAINALNSIGDHGQQVFETMLAQLKQERGEEE